MSKQSDWYFRAHPSSFQESINWLPTLIRMKVFKVFPPFSTACGRQGCSSFYNEDEHEWETRKRRSIYQKKKEKKGMRKKHCEAVRFMESGSIHFYSIKKITCLDSFHYAFSEVKNPAIVFGTQVCVCEHIVRRCSAR